MTLQWVHILTAFIVIHRRWHHVNVRCILINTRLLIVRSIHTEYSFYDQDSSIAVLVDAIVVPVANINISWCLKYK